MNEDVIPIRFRIESTPRYITVYSKSEDDVPLLLEKELRKRSEIKRLTEKDFRLFSIRRAYEEDADVVVGGFAFKKTGSIIEIMNLDALRLDYKPLTCQKKLSLDGRIILAGEYSGSKEVVMSIWERIRYYWVEPCSKDNRAQ